MVHQFGNEQLGEVLNDIERGIDYRTPGSSAKRTGFQTCALVDCNWSCVSQRGCCNTTTEQPRIGAILRIINSPSRRAHRYGCTLNDVASKEAKGGCNDAREQAFRP